MKRIAILSLCVLIMNYAVLAKVNPDEFTETAKVTDVTSGREVSKVSESGRVRYQNQFLATTEIGDKIYELSSWQRIGIGTYPAKFDKRGNRVQFLLHDKNGKVFSSAWYQVTGERSK